MPRTKTPNLTNAEWILIMSACEHKMKSPAVVGDKEWQGHLHQIIINVGAQVGKLPGVIDPAACQIPDMLEERDWNEVYYALDWNATSERGPEAKALMEKIGPDGGNMYG